MLTPIELIKATVDAMIERGFGRIVNITSGAVKAPIDVLGLSNGARSGLTGFVAGLARKTRRRAMSPINNLLPGCSTPTGCGNYRRRGAKTRQVGRPIADERSEAIPARRFGTSEEFGAVCAFLCSAQAGYITGQNLLIDGGAYPGTF